MNTVDVIVPCYRYGHYLKQCVESVLTQTGTAVRVLIIDDASPDNSAEVASELAKSDSRVEFQRHLVNRGHIATYNEGIEWAAADYMLLLSADDYLLPGSLNRAVALMDRHSNVSFTFGFALELNQHGLWRWNEIVPCTRGECVMSGEEFIGVSGARDIVRTPTAVVRTVLQKKVGGYRTELPHAGDMEMWLRLAAYGSVGFVAADQAVYRRHDQNMSLSYAARQSFPDLEQRKAVFDYFFDSCSHKLRNAQGLRDRLLYLLADDTLGRASAAFNDGEMFLSEQLTRFAATLCPGIKRSSTWNKLAFKRLIGLNAWRILQPLAIGKSSRRWLIPVTESPTSVRR